MKSSLKKASEPIMRWFSFLAFCLIALPVFAQTRQPDKTSPAPPPADDQEEPVIPGDWAPELLDAILTSPSPDARDALLDATFAAGPPIIPQLEAALKDDRTAEFAAQSLAFIGGPKAFTILGKLVADPRDLDLRRFFYGALGELRTPEATRFLMDAVTHSDAEPDRTVTEAAIIALTARSDVEMLPPLREADKKIKDVVIRDDLENAIDVIEARSKYLATPQGKSAGGSVEQAVRSYFSPALEPSIAPSEPAIPALKGSVPQKSLAKPAAKGAATGNGTAKSPAQPKPDASVEIQNLTFSPDKSRALARVVFQDPIALADYDMILKKESGDWVIASVWLGNEVDKTPPAPSPKPPREN
ncbi:MAG TPA: HEAT repeat domain-containing protein [Terriglobia bacterium]|nr:HEAT repeat domain-containing protein [Terriglobia bacterium]